MTKNKKTPLSQKDYLKAGGNVCPNCHGKDVEADGHIELDGPSGVQDTKCNGCGATWQDVYVLLEYKNLKV